MKNKIDSFTFVVWVIGVPSIFALWFWVSAGSVEYAEMAEITHTEAHSVIQEVSDEECDPHITGLSNVECDDGTSIEDRIGAIADEYQWDTEELIDLAMCESTMDPDAIAGDYDCFHGLFQWNLCKTNIVTYKCAHDVECSTAASIRAIQRGEKEWRWPNC